MPGYRKKLKAKLERLFDRPAAPQPDQPTTTQAVNTGTSQLSTETFSSAPDRSGHTNRSLVPSSPLDLAKDHPNTVGNDLQPLIVPKAGPADEYTLATEHGPDHVGWNGLRLFADSLNKGVGVFGPLKQAAKVLVSCIDAFETVAENRKDYQELKLELDMLFSETRKYLTASTPPTMTSSIRNLEQGIKRETDLIEQKVRQSGTSKYWNAEQDAEEILECYQRIQGLLQRLTLNANLATWKNVDEIVTESRLSRLPNSPAAYYRSADSTNLRRSGCTKDTRVEVLEQMKAWSCDPKSQKIYWLNGMAGTGKTTIAYSLCERLDQDLTLAASFFCSRQLPECRNVNLIVPSIAYQLSRFSRPFCCAVSPVLEANPDVHNQPILEQFKQLVAQPADQVKDALPTNLVIVIDALDECSAETGVDAILNALLSHAYELPIRFFVTSRPDANILSRMQTQQAVRAKTEMRLHELAHPTVQKDIRTYLITMLDANLTLSEADLDILVQRSGVLFIYAATVVRYIGANKFAWKKRRLSEVLAVSSGPSAASSKEIDALYSAILRSAFENPELASADQSDMRQVLDTVVCACEPLTVKTIAGLLNLDSEESVYPALVPFFSVLQVSGVNRLVTTLHESFPNYMSNKERSDVFHCKQDEHNAYLARLCFDQIGIPSPPFNICHLESSFALDRDVPEMSVKIDKAISNELFYACQYWSAHLRLASYEKDMSCALFRFLSERLLLWVEVMNLKGYISQAMKAMYEVEEWSRKTKNISDNVLGLVQDAWKFVASCASTEVRLSTPHIYVSALSFWPADSPMSKCYIQADRHPVRDSSTAMTVRKVTPLATINTQLELLCFSYDPLGLLLVTGAQSGVIQIWDPRTGRSVGEPLEGHTGPVRSVSYSPNGKFIVSGSSDRTVRIWDSQTGHPVGWIIDDHTSFVYSVAFSPNGQQVVSGSWDRTIRIWDTVTGQATCQPISETDDVNSVAYSPDGKRILSGSDSGNVCIWDSETGRPIGQPLEGHTGHVLSARYSPNGKMVASGARDNTVCIWDASTNQLWGKPLTGHALAVCSIGYSPNGTYLVSGSDDSTVRIWDGITSQPVGQPLTGHTSKVKSVSYSPDGKYIASASEDGIIHIWDALIGPPVGQPLESHTSYVNSVAYSPDSKHIVSGSDDQTVRIWDALTGQPVGQPLQGHSEQVRSVAYSPDSKHIISGSGDSTICIWDALTGQAVGQPLEGHTGEVFSVAYSPNGERMASGSDDKTVRIWDALTGQAVGQPLTGHTGWILSVIYSPSGDHIISGSGDRTIRMWDALTGQPVGQALQGHTREVKSLAYSPSGAYIISGSDDRTIRIWDALTGHPVGQPLEGHTGWVYSVTYSHDGKHIISGSDDNTIRIWDAQTGQLVGQPLEGHTSTVRSAVCSPDGRFMVSGSYDNTIRVWDLQTSRVISESISLHTELLKASYSASATDNNERPKAHICASACRIDGNHRPWTLNEDGWVVVDGDKLLVWVPPDLRDVLVRPQNTILTSSEYGALYLDFDNCQMGEHWAEHFMPLKSSGLLTE